ncbi:MAG: PKD domain-containing protein [Bacteroidota bacterium]
MRRFVVLLVVLCPFLVLSQPTANFTSDTTGGCVPVVINFQDLSTQAVSWEWRAGTVTSSQQNPSFSFLQSGSIDVELIVTDANGVKDTLVRTSYINVHDYPTVQFQADQVVVCAHSTINFSDLSLPGSGNIVQWKWDFGDGSISSTQNPVHAYSDQGNYPVSLEVENQFGCQDRVIRQAYIQVDAPNPSFQANNTLACGPPLVVDFTSTGTTNGTHFWDFGDGNTSTQVNPSHTYTQFGSFDVMHVVEDQAGCRDTLIRNNIVNIGVNTLNVWALDSTLCLGDSTFFKTNAPSNSQITWDFGNGDSSNVLNPYYIYPTHGSYTVTAHIADVSGCQVTLSIPIVVYPDPVIDFTTSNSRFGCDVPYTVDFVNLSTGTTNTSWHFQTGGNFSSAWDTSMTFTSEGEFTVKILGVGPGGCSVVHRKKDYVQIKKIEGGFTADKRGGCAPFSVQFTDTSKSIVPITTWEWDFGNGQTSNLQNPIATYLNPGQYDVRLIVGTSSGCSDTIYTSNYISVGTKPIIDFAIDTNQACAYSPVQLINLSSNANRFIWFFSDGDTAMSTNPQHGFGALGPMDVMLVGINQGCRDTLLQTGIIDILAPLPIMGISDKTVCQTPSDVIFSDLSIGADTTYWTLNGSNMGNQSSWTYTFTQVGSNYVSMTVENFTTGCKITAGDSVIVRPVVADFVVDTNRSCIPFRVNFIDQSINAISWKWDFDHRNDTSAHQNPSYNYRIADVYEPSLMVRNSINCRDTFTYQSLHALETTADFDIISDSAGCVPFVVQLQDLTSGTGPAAQWEWQIGDSSFSGSANPSFILTEEDRYNVKLTVTDVDGCVDSVSQVDALHATQPVPDFIVNPTVNCNGNPSVFVSLSLGEGLSYDWDFGDGGTSTLANPVYTYSQNGLYSISLEVTDVNGCDSSITLSDHILIDEIEANFKSDTTFAACPPLVVNFEADTAFPHDQISYFWDFGDGATSTQATPSHNYTLPGSYTVSLVISSSSGCSDTLIIPNHVLIQGPTGTFTFDPKEACPGAVISFEGQSGAQVSYEWIFGDGLTGNGQLATHTYTTEGTYFPVMAIEDSASCKVYIASNDPVDILPSPTAEFTVNDSAFCENGTVNLTHLYGGSTANLTYSWTTSDGQSSSIPNPSFSFSQPGAFDITLAVRNDLGCGDTLTKTSYINIFEAPVIDIVLSDTAACVPYQTTASLELNGHPYNVNQYEWSAPNAQGQSSIFPYTISEEGNYTLNVRIEDENGCEANSSMDVIGHPLPEPAFSVSDSVGCAPFNLSFTDLTPGNIQQWVWDFGDGNGDQQANPNHTYLYDGQFSLALTVINEFGCEASVIKPNLILLEKPVASFIWDQDSLCPSEPILFTGTSQSNRNLISFEWMFGDGQGSQDEHPTHEYENSGQYDVQLIVTDNLQCKDTMAIPSAVEVIEDVVPEPVDIQFVTIVDEGLVEISFDEFPNTRNDFASYQIMRQELNGQYVIIGEVTDLSQTVYQDNLGQSKLSQGAQCYKVMVLNKCGTGHAEELSDPHCTIDLSSTPEEDAIQLTWTAYQGWPHIRAYRIFRVNNYNRSDMELIGEVPGSTLSFLDTDMFCYDSHSYRIEALHPGLPYSSLSDTTFNSPNHEGPDLEANILLATVENNEFVQVEWEIPFIERASEVILERDAGSGFQAIQSQEASSADVKFQDMTADVHHQSYHYRLFVMDSCGDATPDGARGNSIHLRTRQQGTQVALEWNAYEGWPLGVDFYRVELYNPSTGEFDILDQVDGSETSYRHSRQGGSELKNCYRIIAEAAHSNEIASVSNEECQLLDPIVYYPNAFTPNNDGINDIFLPIGEFLETYQIKIFNRWGKLVFEARQIETGWDGHELNGREAPEGVYVYQIEGKGENGTVFQRTGTVSLIR